MPLALGQPLARLRFASHLDRAAPFGALGIDGEVGEAGQLSPSPSGDGLGVGSVGLRGRLEWGETPPQPLP